MKNASRRMVSCLAFLLALACTGCGTIRGTPPTISANPGSFTMVDAPLPPKQLATAHLLKRLEFSPSPTSLLQVDIRPDDPNVIYYPKLRLQTEEEVVKTEPKTGGDITIPRDEMDRFMHPLRTDTNSFLAITDLKNESAQEAASGRLAADFLYRKVKRNALEMNLNINIVDREKAFLTMKGEGELDPAALDYSDQELMNEAAKFNYTTYWLSGAVTTFSLENKELEFSYVLDSESYQEFARQMGAWVADYRAYKEAYQRSYLPAYEAYARKFSDSAATLRDNYAVYEDKYNVYADEDYRRYKRAYDKYELHVYNLATLGNFVFLPLHLALEIVTLGAADTWARPSPYPMEAMIQKLPEPSLGALASRAPILDLSRTMPLKYDAKSLMTVFVQNEKIPDPVRRMATVCNVGITIRMVSGKTSKIVWIGNGTVRSTDLQVGMQDVCSALVDVLFDDAGLVDPSLKARSERTAKP